MKTITVRLFFFCLAAIFIAGCAATYHQDCRISLESEPPGAEIWKDDYYIGVTPNVLHYTATSEDDERGYLLPPPLLIKKEGYKPYLLEMKLDLGEGYDWEGVVVLEPAAEKK